MINFRKNKTENSTANIIWQYVSHISNDLSELGSNIGDMIKQNVLYFNAKFNHYGMNKCTEMLMRLNSKDIRIECKYISKNSNFDRMIAHDLIAFNHCDEDEIIIVLDGEGAVNNHTIESYKSDIKHISSKTIHFVMIGDLDKFIRSNYAVYPSYEKRWQLMEALNK